MKMRFTKKSVLSLLLSFSMIIGLLSGMVIVKETSEAASGPSARKFELGEKQVGNGYYTYPNAQIVNQRSEDEFYQYLTVLVDSGYLKVTDPKLGGVTGDGIAYGDGMDEGSGYDPLKTNQPYEAINFDLGKDNAVNKATVEKYIQSIQFTTAATGPQKVTVTVTTRSDSLDFAPKTRVDGVDVDVHYFNGHFYGFVNKAETWNDAFKKANNATFYGGKGYLATLTSRAEDRFIYETFENFGNGSQPPKGWIGATRALQDNTGAYTKIVNPTPPSLTWWQTDKDQAAAQAFLKECQEKMVWRWVSGPEAGTEFGYQNSVCADNIVDDKGRNDGGFVTYDGLFSNWNDTMEHVEPNGGWASSGTGEEAYGYYGEYKYGRWNDHKDSDSDGKGFYIEFEGASSEMEDDGHVVYEENEKSSGDIVTDEDFFGRVFNPGPSIINTRADGKNIVGTVLEADISEINFVKYNPYNQSLSGGHTISYQWFVVSKEDDETLIPIEEATVGANNQVVVKSADGKTYTLTENTLGYDLVVRVTEYDPQGNVVGVGTSKPYRYGDRSLSGSVTIEEDSITDDGNIKVKADVSKVRPKDTHDNLHYTWYTVDDEGNPKEKLHEADNDPYYEIPEGMEGEDIIVVVESNDSDIEGEITSNTYHVKEPITGAPEITANGANVAGTTLTANVENGKVTDKKTQTATFKGNDFDYQWYVYEDGEWKEIPGATKQTYTLTKNTAGKEIRVKATVKEDNPNYAGAVTSAKFDKLSDADKKDITGKPKIDQVGDTLRAEIDDIGPKDANFKEDDFDYQWKVNGEPKGDNSSTFDGSDLKPGDVVTVEVTVKEDNPSYKGSAESDPTPFEDDGIEVKDGQIKITGYIVIENQTLDDEGNPVNREGTILFANIDNVKPNPDCHSSLSYQWYVKDDNGNWAAIPGATNKNYKLPKEYVGKTLSVNATADGKTYVGTVTSDPYVARRTSADFSSEVDETGRKHIFVTPAEDDSKYTVTDYNDIVPDNMDVFLVDKDGNRKEITGDPDYMDEDGYYIVDADETLEFVVDADKDYVVRQKQIKSNTEYVETPVIPDDDIHVSVADDGTITITVDPADKTRKYAVLKKDGDKYVSVTVTKDPKTGEYVYDPKGSAVWSDSGEGVVTFTELPNDGTYKIVSVPADKEFSDISPEDVANNGSGGSRDLTAADAKGYTDADMKKAEDMLNGSFTNPKDGSIITEVNDYTVDKILESEKEWNKLTEAEKAAVNAKLKELGCKYTYEELLKMAKNWKIPYFQMKKVMKKGTKYKPKMIKCSGATIIASSKKPKIASVNKKGVIKAKKPGKSKVTITVVKGNYSNRLVINVVVRKKFKNAKELKKIKQSNKIKTPTLLLDKKREVKKSTKIGIKGLAKGATVKYQSLNNKVIKVSGKNKKGKYTAKKVGSTLLKATVKQNNKKYILYLYVSGFKSGKKAKKK